MENRFPGGVWPVMLTPYTAGGEIDYRGLSELIEWYIRKGSDGLFAVTQSSEMFRLSLEERVNLAKFVKAQTRGRVPVIASGHVSDDPGQQEEEILAISETGVDAMILLSNRFAAEGESDAVWLKNAERLLGRLPADLKLGMYECPCPYHRVMSEETIRWCAGTGRFYFLKDTSCDADNIRMKLKACSGSTLKIYNANTATLRESLLDGAAGYSGVMANTQCRLYAELCRSFRSEAAAELSDDLTMCALIESQCYPNSAKYYLAAHEGVPILSGSRTHRDDELNLTQKKEMDMLKRVTERLEQRFLKEE